MSDYVYRSQGKCPGGESSSGNIRITHPAVNYLVLMNAFVRLLFSVCVESNTPRRCGKPDGDVAFVT